MPYYVGLDISKKTTSVCVVDAEGAIVQEATVETTPKAIGSTLRGARRRYGRVGMEASPLAAWLYSGLAKFGLPIISIDPKYAHAVLATRRNKTDRNDAQGIAELMRIGTFKVAHIRSAEAHEMRALLVARDVVVTRRADIDGVIRSLLLGFGLKLAAGAKKSFLARVKLLSRQHSNAAAILAPLIALRASLDKAVEAYDRQVADVANGDPVCRRLMTAPGVGPLGALAYKSAIDHPERFAKSRNVGAHFGLTPRTYQSGERSVQRGITRAGDAFVRKLLYLGATSLMRRGARASWLSRWGAELMERTPYKRAMVAVARKLAVVLHRMWLTETDFKWERGMTASS